MKHTFITAAGREKTINIPDDVLVQGRKERLTVKETIERYLSDEGYVVDELLVRRNLVRLLCGNLTRRSVC